MAITTGRVRSAGPFSLVQVGFGPNERPCKRFDRLELVPDEAEELAELLAVRKWSGPDALRSALADEKIGHLPNRVLHPGDIPVAGARQH